MASAKIKIKLLSSISGPTGAHEAGTVISVAAADAKEYIERGFAEAVAVKRENRSEKRSA